MTGIWAGYPGMENGRLDNAILVVHTIKHRITGVVVPRQVTGVRQLIYQLDAFLEA